MNDAFPSFPMPRACPFDPAPELRELGNVARVRIWDGSTPWLVSGYSEQRKLLQDERISTDPRKEGYPHTSEGAAVGRQAVRAFGFMDDPEHHEYRQLVSRFFTAERARAMRPTIQSHVDRMIDEMLEGERPVDLVKALALPLPSIVVYEVLGVPYDDHGFFHEKVSVIVSDLESPESMFNAVIDLKGYLGTLVEQKSEDPVDDVISGLVADGLRPGLISLDEILSSVLLLVAAGYETTANMISLGVLALLSNPQQLEMLRPFDNEEVLSRAVSELLRYLSVVHNGTRRVALDDIHVDGQVIKAGEGIIFPNEAANRDPSAFAGDPDAVDILRPVSRHLAFGHGVHICLGQWLARAELEIAYSTLFSRLPDLRLAVPFEDLRFREEMSVYGLHALPVTW